ncbi:phage DNA packaging protein J [Kingella kingae]|nr:phage DNA packaging protein J [Kingella kingae]MDK4535401.1 phage DNA packaging protein J [Kingella kingae]
MSKGKKRSGARPGRPQPLRGTKGKRKGDQQKQLAL